MLCSILISNFNKSKYIERCIESLRIQSYKNFEIIFSDNNSSDNSLEIVSKFNEVKILKTERETEFPALNQINVINKAFDNSKGDIIFLLDSDDFYSEDKIAKVIKFQKDHNAEFICDVPKVFHDKNKMFDFKSNNNLKFLRTWPIIYPTSSISCTRNFFLNFKEYLLMNNFNRLEIDFRLNVYANFMKKTKIMYDNNLTFYTQTSDGIMSSYKKFDKNWWKRRMQAHQYLHTIVGPKKLKYYKNLDYYVTNLINKIF